MVFYMIVSRPMKDVALVCLFRNPEQHPLLSTTTSFLMLLLFAVVSALMLMC